MRGSGGGEIDGEGRGNEQSDRGEREGQREE